MAKIDNKSEALRKFKAHLVEGKFDQAKVVQRDSEMSMGDILPTVNTMFTELMERKEYNKALELGRYYRLDGAQITDLVTLEFSRLFAVKDYEGAIKWANDNQLSEVELTKAALKLFQKLLDNGEVERALELPEECHLKPDKFNSIAQSWFNEAYQREEFLPAAKLGWKFGVAQKRVLIAAKSATIEAIKEEDWNRVVDIQKDFDLFSDAAFNELPEKDCTSLVETVLNQGIVGMSRNKRFKKIKEIVGGLGILEIKQKHKDLEAFTKKCCQELVAIHNDFLGDQQFEKARDWINDFQLLDDHVPSDTRHQVIMAALKYHNACLDGLEYEMARNTALFYGLFGNNLVPESYQQGTTAAVKYLGQVLEEGKIDQAKKCMEDYELRKEPVNELAERYLVHHLQQRNFEPAFAIVKSFQIDLTDENIQREARNQFNESIEQKMVEIAADIGHVFKLDSKQTYEAAMRAWEWCITNGKIDKAYQFYRKYRFPARKVQSRAREIYEYARESNQMGTAEKIRRQYGLQMSLLETIVELLRKILKLLGLKMGQSATTNSEKV